MIIIFIVISLITQSSNSGNYVVVNSDSLSSIDSTNTTSYEDYLRNDSTELILRKLKIYSGKRPVTEVKENPKELYWVLRIHFNRRISASRVIDLVRDGKKLYLEYDPVISFETLTEVLDYAEKNGIKDIVLE